MFLVFPRKRVGISKYPPYPGLGVLEYNHCLEHIVLGGARVLVRRRDRAM